ncbi:MAG: endolytic transglycosylase MltG, partial [Clostridium sp.]|nr:endolytic transglycosylase MltG [Clostridium sp.]
IDATVVYALGLDMKDKVYLKDLEVDSPYNTYKINSLPIGPIANPGTQAIKAALNPETTDYIYYVLDKQNKKHFFTNSYDEFLVKKKEFAN